MFSTQFISAMHVDDSTQLEDYLVISDQWHKKYNEPIQACALVDTLNSKVPSSSEPNPELPVK